MKASPADQRRLLDVAALDAQIAAADHARRNPAQAERVQELLAQRTTLNAELTRLLGERDDARVELSRLESDVQLVDKRTARDNDLLATTTNAKEAQGLEHEIASLARRKRELEDAELEVMERLEQADAAVAAQEDLIRTVNDEGQQLSADGKTAVAEATAKHEAATRDRAAVVAELPAEVVALYDRIAARGTGAAELVRRTCEGCHMVLSGTDLAALRQLADDDVATCPECGAILVRGEDSGL